MLGFVVGTENNSDRNHKNVRLPVNNYGELPVKQVTTIYGFVVLVEFFSPEKEEVNFIPIP